MNFEKAISLSVKVVKLDDVPFGIMKFSLAIFKRLFTGFAVI